MAISDKATKKDERFRNCTMIVYPDSVVPNWIEILRSYKLPFIVSPLHDKDLNPEAPPDITSDGEILPKKPHYHVAILCDGNHPLSFFEEIATKIKAFKYVYKINNVRSMIRYFCHMDDPDKFQYSENDIRCYCGADYKDYMEMSGRVLLLECKKIQKFIRSEGIMSFDELSDYLCFNNLDDWYYIISAQRTMFFSSYMKDIYFKNKAKEKENLSYET